ncbi:MAG TPA: nucleotidyltransferase domain-containing protein [Leptospiraceae bacterium]|nr:nucleotidyltransferase domain-containing protein [Leptospiraceae bacterium]
MNLEEKKQEVLRDVQERCASLNYTLLYATVVGSHAYGNSTPESDVDVRFVFAAPEAHYLGFGGKDSLTIETEDVFGYEFVKWSKLLLENNPTVMEMLFMDVESILYLDRCMLSFLNYKSNLLSKKCLFSYLKYAENQIYKAKSCTKDIVELLEQYEELLKLNKVSLQNLAVKQAFRDKPVNYPDTWVYDIFADTIGDLIDKYKDFKQSKFPYSDLGAKRREYLKKFGVDMKNLSHAIRLSRTCKDIFEKKELKVLRSDANYFLEIKQGKFSLEHLENEFKSLKDDILELSKTSDLPEVPDRKGLEEVTVKALRMVLFDV